MLVARKPAELVLDGPALVDRFLEGAIELDVDILCDGESGWVASVLEHVERAGVHSGDSACVVPAPSVTARLESEIRALAATLAQALGARGLLNLQLALHDGELYVLEANPRASRTVPFVSKATGIPLVDHACRLLLGASLGELGLPERVVPGSRVGEGGDLPRRAPRRRRRPGSRDALDRRGDGERPDSGDRLPARAPGRRARDSAAGIGAPL